jgi:5'-deoxynucleotidase YfbR-like HD superfamily hydrolase
MAKNHGASMILADQTFTRSLYVSTYTGKQFFPLAPTPEQIDIEDIAHGLAYQCRFNGQTRHFYSVAQHSLIVADLVPKRLRRAALLHDAAEAYMGDMVKPLKQLFPLFSDIEAKVMTAIGLRYGVGNFNDRAIKRADLIALAMEKRDLMPNSTEPWESLKGIVASPLRIMPMSPQEAKASFLAAFLAVQ